MILQALAQHYEALADQGKLARPGWSNSGISFALCINDAGALEQVMPLQEERKRGNKTVWGPQSLLLPAPVKRTVGIEPNFLWDNSTYLLGVDEKGKPQRSRNCFAACKALHHRLLEEVESPAARAVLAFFDRWDPEAAREHPVLAEYIKEILTGANLVFRYDGAYLQNDPLIRQAWQAYYDSAGDGPERVCLITGKKGPVEAVHPAVKGVPGAQSTGAALVSFNAPAFCSYGQEQNLNAPTSKYAAFAYTAALNYLLADREHCYRMGDTTLLFWAKSGRSAPQNLFLACMTGAPTSYTSSDLATKVEDLCRGTPVEYEEEKIDPQMDFYILGLSPNAARLSVRFFLHNTFGAFLQNLQAHYRRLEMVRSTRSEFETVYLSTLLNEAVDQNTKTKLYDKLFGETLQAILTNTRYPASLRNFVYLRIRSEREINRTRTGILKANLMKIHEHLPKNPQLLEALQMELNEHCTYPPYLLGRLFSVMEQIQLASAEWKLNRTIKDSFFSAATATPNVVFSKLFPLSEYHMKKLKRDKFYLARDLEKTKRTITSLLTVPIPQHFTPDEMDCFYIGYYHETCKLNPIEEEPKNA